MRRLSQAPALSYKIQIQLNEIFHYENFILTLCLLLTPGACLAQTMPCAIMALATFMKPAMLAPFT